MNGFTRVLPRNAKRLRTLTEDPYAPEGHFRVTRVSDDS
jgi:hypothetical protein